MSKYTPDILGSGFEQLQFVQNRDYEGKVVCTLIRKLAKQPCNKAVLYIHGFTDYFFQEELADQFIEQGYNFYALDLRKSGRSILPNQIPFNMHDISEYYEDIDVAIKQIKAEFNDEIIINAHSTGGLIAVFYATLFPNACDAVILNSPFLEINKSWFLRKIAIPFVNTFRGILPNIKIIAGFSPFYGQSLHVDYYGEWNYNLKWKPIRCDYITLGWIAGVYRAHNQLKKGKVAVPCPVLVICSSKSLKSRVWTKEFKNGDAVLSTDDIQKYSTYLGKNVTLVAIDNGMHDLILSKKPIREQVYATMFNWLKKINL